MVNILGSQASRILDILDREGRDLLIQRLPDRPGWSVECESLTGDGHHVEGASVRDALGQLCQVLELELDEPIPFAVTHPALEAAREVRESRAMVGSEVEA